ncbi:MAG: [NiFe]-hydrogenase assembly chaperone HybE [Burkholderiales bacterium]|nr:[NiFe]-hydrogenase assembly chaperone HybE [Ferrovum sp.]
MTEYGGGMEERPIAQLESVFSRIGATRMVGVPILNPALRVEAVGFRHWEGRWIGVLVTPWMINLLLLSGQDAPLESLVLDQKRTWIFPSGTYEFMGLNEAELGTCHICPLISPVTEFATHEAAVMVAREIARELFSEKTLAHKPVSRRDFLRVPFLGR